jgi:hypothetical protein
MKASLGEVISVDGKSLRGSRRELPALGVVVAVGQEIRVVLAQEEIKGENAIEATLRLIQGLPLEGWVVTLDAGLNQREIAHAIVEKGGPIWGLWKKITLAYERYCSCQEWRITAAYHAEGSATWTGWDSGVLVGRSW